MKLLSNLTLAAVLAAAVTPAADASSFSDVTRMSSPSSSEANIFNTNFAGYCGMGVFSFISTTGKTTINRKCEEPAILTFNGVEIGHLSAALDTEVNIIDYPSFGGVGDDGLPTMTYTSNIFFLFDEAFRESPDPKFQKDGTYVLTIPDNFFFDSGTPLTGASYTYHFSSAVPEPDFTYELTPTTTEDVTELPDITVIFPNARRVTYIKTGRARLLDPDGKRISGGTMPRSVSGGKGLHWHWPDWQAKEQQLEWKEGTYTFVVPANTVSVDDYRMSEESDETNFEGLTAVYNVKKQTGVTMTGELEADSYTVVATDGAVIAHGAGADVLTMLPEGIYIINGKKTLVKKW